MPLDQIITILAVRHCIFQSLIGKKIKAHLPDVLLTKLRQDMGNIIENTPLGESTSTEEDFRFFLS